MDCRTCQPTLIDLLHGELATDAAEEAHAHLKECASCRGAFDKLSQGLRFAQRIPLMEPPQAVGARLLQLAEQHAHAATALREQEASKPGAWQSLLDFVARFAMTRQVGMATIMLLIVAVGMWSLPELQRSRVADGGTVVSPEPVGEVAPSPVAEAAAPAEAAPAAAAPSQRPATVSAAAEERDESQAEMMRSRASSSEGGGSLGKAASRKSAAQPTADLYRPDAARSRRRAGPSDAKREAEAFPGNTGLADKTEEPNTLPSATSAAPKGKSRSLDEVTSGRDDLLDSALAGGTRGKAKEDAPADRAQGRGAAAPASPPPAPTMAVEGEADVETEAKKKSKYKSASAADDCDPARMREYQRTVDAAPSSAAGGNALLAMARCRNRSGEYTLARGLLERATRNLYVADRAKAMLGAGAAKPAKAAPAAAEPASAEER